MPSGGEVPAAPGNFPNHVCSYPCSPEVQSILKISQPQEPELMNANPSPPVSRFYSVTFLEHQLSH